MELRQKIARRIWRKRHLSLTSQQSSYLATQRDQRDRLETPAHRLWHGDLTYVRFPSNIGDWVPENGEHVVPMGGYFFALNPGCGGRPRVTWHLRTGRAW